MLYYYDFSLICFLVFILLLWNCSSIVETFAEITHTKNIFNIDKFHDYRAKYNVFMSYPNFLYEYKPCFITELLSCNICLTFWSNILSLPVVLYIFPHEFLWSNLYLFPINYVITILLLLITKNLYNNQKD